MKKSRSSPHTKIRLSSKRRKIDLISLPRAEAASAISLLDKDTATTAEKAVTGQRSALHLSPIQKTAITAEKLGTSTRIAPNLSASAMSVATHAERLVTSRGTALKADKEAEATDATIVVSPAIELLIAMNVEAAQEVAEVDSEEAEAEQLREAAKLVSLAESQATGKVNVHPRLAAAPGTEHLHDV